MQTQANKSAYYFNNIAQKKDPLVTLKLVKQKAKPIENKIPTSHSGVSWRYRLKEIASPNAVPNISIMVTNKNLLISFQGGNNKFTNSSLFDIIGLIPHKFPQRES